MFFSNWRFSPSCDDLILNDVHVDRAENFRYLGTVLDGKLNFKMNTDHAAEKARRMIFIMNHLSFLKITKPSSNHCVHRLFGCVQWGSWSGISA